MMTTLSICIRNVEYTDVMDSPLRTFKAQIFQALAHPTRIAVAEALSHGELPAGALQLRLGVEQANLSQHLGVLRGARVVVTRRAGNQVFYSLRDPVLTKVLDLLKAYFHSQLDETRALLVEMKAERRRRG
jgi:DNA-binding transcriptional ArsR family regulator